MAEHPFHFGPLLVVALDPEEVGVPVEVRLEVLEVHAHVAAQVAPHPRAEVVDHGHVLKVLRVPGVGLAGPVDAPHRLDQRPVGLLHVVEDLRALGDVREQGLLYALRGRLAVPAPDGDNVLARVDRHGDADLVLAEALLRPPPGVTLEVGVSDVHLVDPHLAPQHDPVLVAVHGGHDPVAPLPGRLVGDAAELGAGVELHVEAHEAYEDHPPPERPLRVLEDGPSERVELPAAPAARPGAVARGRGAVGGAALVRARRAPRPRPPLPRRLVVGPGADELAAPPGLDGIHQKGEVRVGKRVDPAREGVRALHLALSHPRRRPSGRDVAKHRARWAPAQIYVWQRDCTTLPRRLDEHALIPTLVDCRKRKQFSQLKEGREQKKSLGKRPRDRQINELRG